MLEQLEQKDKDAIKTIVIQNVQHQLEDLELELADEYGQRTHLEREVRQWFDFQLTELCARLYKAVEEFAEP